MTRDHDAKRAIRARMKSRGERYTEARAALVAPAAPPSMAVETSLSQGGTMPGVSDQLLAELDEQGFALIRSFFTADEIAAMTVIVDEIVGSTLAEKQQRKRERVAAGEPEWVNVWHPGAQGVVFAVITERPDARWLVDHPGLVELATATEGKPATIGNVGVHTSLPGYGHEGFHPDKTGPSPAVGAWDGTEFIIPLSSYRPDTGTIRALPGSHRNPPDWEAIGGSAMPPHPDEIRIDAGGGDLFVFSSHLWRSETFNAGVEARKGLWAS